MWDYILGGATVFGLIVTFGAWLNGRATRKALKELIAEEAKNTRELIENSTKRTERLLEKLSEQHTTMIEHIESIKIHKYSLILNILHSLSFFSQIGTFISVFSC